MKLIIDISEDEYDLFEFSGDDLSPLCEAIANGILIDADDKENT